MECKSKKYDYSLTIDVGTDKAIGILSSIFGGFDLDNKKVSASEDIYLSEIKRNNSWGWLIRGYPVKVQWSVHKISDMKSLVNFSLSWTLWLYLFTRFILLICFGFITILALSEYSALFDYIVTQMFSTVPMFSSFVLLISASIFLVITYRTVAYHSTSRRLIVGNLRRYCKKNEIALDVHIIKFLAKDKLAAFYLVPPLIVLALITCSYNKMIESLTLWAIPAFMQMTFYFSIKRQSVRLKTSHHIVNFVVILLFCIYLIFVPYNFEMYADSLLNGTGIFGESSLTNGVSATTNTVSGNESRHITGVVGKLHLAGSIVLLLIFFVCFLGVILILFVFSCSVNYLKKGKQSSKQYRYYKKVFDSESAHLGEVTLESPRHMKFAIVLSYILLGFLLWKTILYNLSFMAAVFGADNNSLATIAGNKVITGITLLGISMARMDVHSGTFSFVVLFSIAIPVLFLILFIYLHLRSLLVHVFWFRSLIPIKDKSIINKINEIGKSMGVKNVKCVKDPRSKSPSVCAAVLGFIPQKYVIFTDDGLNFIKDFPEHSDVIYAHEIDHLSSESNYCMNMWIATILSRIALVGPGFLSVLIDPIDLEDRADDTALRFLKKNNAKTELFSNALAMKKAYKPQQKKSTDKNTRVRLVAILSELIVFLKVIYILYFETETYANLHRRTTDRVKRVMILEP